MTSAKVNETAIDLAIGGSDDEEDELEVDFENVRAAMRSHTVGLTVRDGALSRLVVPACPRP
jgi:hypothetical protein